MDKGRTEQIIEKLIDSIENGQSVPFGAGKVAVNRDETIMMLRELESIVNGELKIYREFNDRKGKIINDAKKEAEEIIYEAEQTASRIRVTKRMSTIGTAFRAESLDKEERQALRTAHDIYAASLIYTDEMLTEVNDVVAQAYDLVANQYGIMINTLQEKAELIAKNKAELMGSLKELSKEDRYTQILELGQLLSHELYSERMKARAMEENGSYQMEMMFEEQTATQQPEMVQQPQLQYNQQQSVAVQEPVVDSVFESVQQEPVVDSAFASVAQEPVVDSAFASVQPETPAAPVQQAKHISDEEHSIEAVSKTLEMFKNYRPGGNK